jgi:hypothetical protein
MTPGVSAAERASDKFRRAAEWHAKVKTTEAFQGKTLTFLALGPREQIEITWDDIRAMVGALAAARSGWRRR